MSSGGMCESSIRTKRPQAASESPLLEKVISFANLTSRFQTNIARAISTPAGISHSEEGSAGGLGPSVLRSEGVPVGGTASPKSRPMGRNENMEVDCSEREAIPALSQALRDINPNRASYIGPGDLLFGSEWLLLIEQRATMVPSVISGQRSQSLANQLAFKSALTEEKNR